MCLSRQVKCNHFYSPTPPLAFPTSGLGLRLRRLLSYQMCVRVGGKKGLSFLSSLSQVVILSDYFRLFLFFFRICCYWSPQRPQSTFLSPHCEGGSRGYHGSGRTRHKYEIQTEELLFVLLLKAQESICRFYYLPTFSLVF